MERSNRTMDALMPHERADVGGRFIVSKWRHRSVPACVGAYGLLEPGW